MPALMWSIDDGIPSKYACTCPPMRSVRAGADPRYGTCAISMPAIILNSSPHTWGPDPTPAEAMLSFPGFALACAMNWGIVVAGKDAFTSMTKGERMILATGAMSRMKVEIELLVERRIYRGWRADQKKRVAIRGRAHNGTQFRYWCRRRGDSR